MSNRTVNLTDELYDYLVSVSVRETELMGRLREETARHEMARMQIAPDQGQFLAFLVSMLGARQALEVGVFTGYSALWIAQALPAEGRLVACDVNAEWSSVAERYWREAGLDDRIELRLAPAADTLDALIQSGAQGAFDFAFIDADKTNYDRYYEQCLALMRPGGVIAVDNVLWHGRVLEAASADEDTRAIQALNRKLGGDDRVDLSMVPIGDGLMLARKR